MTTGHHFQTIIIGAGAAGLMAASRLGQAGHSVLLLDAAPKIGEKIRIAGGGFCNFTNTHIDGFDASNYYVSENPKFVRYALSNFTAQDFIALVEQYQIPYTEKHRGQLFCDREQKASSKDIVAMLLNECRKGNVDLRYPCKVHAIHSITTENGTPHSEHLDNPHSPRFRVETTEGFFTADHLIIATGGLAIPKIGATDFGYEIAQSFGHTIIPPRPALVPLHFDFWEQDHFVALAGISLPVSVSTAKDQKGKKTITFQEDLLFRHKGLSGPAILQISSYWQPGQTITLNFSPEVDLESALIALKTSVKYQLERALTELIPAMPKRLIQFWLNRPEFAEHQTTPLPEIPNKILQALATSLNQWTITPCGTDGYKTAEATRGGINTKELNAKTMESQYCPNLYCIGEVVDVVGWLGGYNFQWAWASAVCAAKGILAK
ncbi:aminoacetone oxidase family FAD-binding enzyme [Ignatzschineria ureiclastica]|uniref:Aminoacetone oxidase family FAD-binding enzyme n=1 Tax=Ignatzschineria ureiclastica TaxID=472582 RepID=A0A2U2ACS5_9GAMM|nr:NAD(P)/FAD-dependent oxidoreductase [Ignatzschineria ureiclastica]PWD80458.1 aminoacetone oxidase family FAD-binding enzyme [Ignatzschineria ureiclastica]GGZ99347.1 membrane protein [Ignatzschineria ureiclastica]